MNDICRDAGVYRNQKQGWRGVSAVGNLIFELRKEVVVEC